MGRDISKTIATASFALVASAGAAQADFTYLRVCHAGGPPVYMAIYETYQGLLSGYTVSGWWLLAEGDGCFRETLTAREVRAIAFAAINEDGEFVALPFDFDVSGPRNFGRSAREFCVPVQEKLDPFDLQSGSQEGLTPPCAANEIAVEASFNILGGSASEAFYFNVQVPETLPPAHPEYARIREEEFGIPSARTLRERERQRAAERAAREASRTKEDERLEAAEPSWFDILLKRLGLVPDIDFTLTDDSPNGSEKRSIVDDGDWLTGGDPRADDAPADAGQPSGADNGGWLPE